MNSTSSKSSGILLIISSILFWVAWYLMPDQGTADAMHILTIVKTHRQAVLISVIVQVISCLCYLITLFLLTRIVEFKDYTLIGVILLAIGVMGMCMDGFFHLLAYNITDDTLTPGNELTQLMTLMQTRGLFFLVPLLLPFFLGSLLLPMGLAKQNDLYKLSLYIVISGFLTAILGGVVVNKILGYGRSTLVLLVLGMFAAGHVAIGAGLLRKRAFVG